MHYTTNSTEEKSESEVKKTIKLKKKNMHAFVRAFTEITNTRCFKFYILFNSSTPGQKGHHFADNIFRCIFMNEKFNILIQISIKFAPKDPIDNSLALV